MKRKYRWNKKTFFLNLLLTVMILLSVWIVLSYLQVVVFNLNESPNELYSKYNLIVMLLKLSC